MVWLGRHWHVGTDDMAVPAALLATCRIAWAVLTALVVIYADGGGRLDLCDVYLTCWAGALLVITVLAEAVEILIVRRARGAILHDAAARQLSVPPLLTVHLGLSAAETTCAAWGLYIALQRNSWCGASELGNSRASTQRLLAWMEAGGIVTGSLLLWLLLGERLPQTADGSEAGINLRNSLNLLSQSSAPPDMEDGEGRPRASSVSVSPAALHTRLVRRLCCCVGGVDAGAQEQIAMELARLLPAGLDLTLTDLVAGLALVQLQHAQQLETLRTGSFVPAEVDAQGTGATTAPLPAAEPTDDAASLPTASHASSGTAPLLPLGELTRHGWYALAIYGWPWYTFRLRGWCLLGVPCAMASLTTECALRSLCGGCGWCGSGGLCCGLCGARGSAAGVTPLGGVKASRTGLSHTSLLRSLRHAAADLPANSCGCVPCTGTRGSEPPLLHTAVWTNSIDGKPFALIIDRAASTLILAIRGTLSAVDVATDMVADFAPLPSDVEGGGGRETPMAHGGMLRTAESLHRLLLKDEFLTQLLLGPEAPCAGCVAAALSATCPVSACLLMTS